MNRAGDAAVRLAREVAAAADRPGALRTLFLDLDGTLAPIASRPRAARVPPANVAAIERLLALGWTVAVVSGRDTSDARSLISIPGLRIFGSHGFDGAWSGPRPRLPAPIARRLDALARDARALARRHPGSLAERKMCGVAFHERNIPPGRLRAWRSDVAALLGGHAMDGLELVRGRRVLEVRLQEANKGRVIASMPGWGRGARRDRSVVALGDDRTDENLFRRLRPRGLGVLVGRPRRGTAALRRLPSTTAVTHFLESLGGGR
jgi:trehalose-phosphatase